MKANRAIPLLVATSDWMALSDDGGYFRWLPGGVRQEIHVSYNKAGQIHAWSVWENRRTKAPDQEPGNRPRLEAFIKAPR